MKAHLMLMACTALSGWTVAAQASEMTATKSNAPAQATSAPTAADRKSVV